MSAHYDQFDYREYWQGREYEHLAEESAIRELLKEVPRGGKWLEVGCGYGRLVHIYADFCSQIYLLDPSQKNLDQVKAVVEAGKLGKVNLFLGQAEKLPLRDSSIDAVIMVRVMHHLPEPIVAISELARVLRPGGYLILEFANKLNLKNVASALVSGRIAELNSHSPQEKRSVKNVARKTIPFVNHHPALIKEMLLAKGFRVLRLRSVSNLRHWVFKLLLPKRLILALEEATQGVSERTGYLPGPSVFLLARKGMA